MWLTKIRLKHKCLFGDNCEKAKATCVNFSFNWYKKGSSYYVHHFGTVHGDNYKTLLDLFRKDKRTHYFEFDGNTFFIVEKRTKREIPGMFISPEIIYTKPVTVDIKGYETWELAALNKIILMKFIKRFKNFEILKMERTKLRDIYFPRLSPDLSPGQRNAMDLAMREGYYEFPKNIELEKLAEISKVSRATFREHLRKAERKVLGGLYK